MNHQVFELDLWLWIAVKYGRVTMEERRHYVNYTWVYVTVRNGGWNGGGGQGVRPPNNCTGPWQLCFPRGPLKTPPPQYKNVFYKCFKLLSITINKTCCKNTWVTIKTVPVAQRHKSIMMTRYSRTLTSQEHYDDRSCARPLLSPAQSFG